MADAVGMVRAAALSFSKPAPRHSALVRVTHWITAICFFALLVTGAEIVVSHPRFYWGETGNVLTPSLFDLPIPASRSYVRTGYSFVMPDQNGWSRSLHFQTAWILVATGLLYAVWGVVTRHVHKNLLPARSDLRWQAVAGALRYADARSYNLVQQLAYLFVIFVLFPLVIWTGLAMSPAVVSVFPAAVTVFGGHQSARTIHFFLTLALVVFVLLHLAMVYRAGWSKRSLAMITGRADGGEEHP